MEWMCTETLKHCQPLLERTVTVSHLPEIRGPQADTTGAGTLPSRPGQEHVLAVFCPVTTDSVSAVLFNDE